MAKTIKFKPATNEALADLFLSMAMKDDDRQEAERAFTEFYDCYKNYLFTVVKNVCQSWETYGDELIQAVHENTFLTVYEKAESFMIIEDLPFERQELRMKAWLGKIAYREMLLLLRKFKDEKERIDYHDDLSFLEQREEADNSQVNEEILLVEKALRTLSDRDRHILITYMMFEDGNKQLPKPEIQRLAEIWDVLPDNMRQIKKRSIAKIKQYIETSKNK
jgi:RNA polymerase sigma factor (sigma-70 family)